MTLAPRAPAQPADALARFVDHSQPMEVLAYGLFEDRAAADRAIARLERRDLDEVLTIHEHQGELTEPDIQGQGTRSRLYAVLGLVFAAVLGGVLAAVFLGDRFTGGPAVAGLVGAVLAGAFGVLASIAGAALPRRELEALEREIVNGKTLVTIDVESKPAAEALQPDLERCGALRTGILYGPGLGSSRIVRRRPGPASC
jgi:hypothetical protein